MVCAQYKFLSDWNLITVVFEVLTALLLNIQVFYGVTPRRLLNSYRRFGGTTFRSYSNCVSFYTALNLLVLGRMAVQWCR
jgi:hypothetical protein